MYDDPAGLSLERICAITRVDDKNAVQEILKHVPWATKITVGVYSFSKNPAALKQAPVVEAEKAVELEDYSKDRFIEVLMLR